MNTEQAIKTAYELKEWCKGKKNCSRCPFKINTSIANYICIINYPADWQIDGIVKKQKGIIQL